MTNPKLPLGIEPLGTLSRGLRMTFRGCAPDESGEFEGEYVEVELLIPSLNFANIKRLQTFSSTRGDVPMTQSQIVDEGIKTVATALRQNYRGVPDWLIEQSIDPGNAAAIAHQLTHFSTPAPEAADPATA